MVFQYHRRIPNRRDEGTRQTVRESSHQDHQPEGLFCPEGAFLALDVRAPESNPKGSLQNPAGGVCAVRSVHQEGGPPGGWALEPAGSLGLLAQGVAEADGAPWGGGGTGLKGRPLP